MYSVHTSLLVCAALFPGSPRPSGPGERGGYVIFELQYFFRGCVSLSALSLLGLVLFHSIIYRRAVGPFHWSLQ